MTITVFLSNANSHISINQPECNALRVLFSSKPPHNAWKKTAEDENCCYTLLEHWRMTFNYVELAVAGQPIWRRLDVVFWHIIITVSLRHTHGSTYYIARESCGGWWWWKQDHRRHHLPQLSIYSYVYTLFLAYFICTGCCLI